MENAEKILSHIRVHPYFKKLGVTRCLDQVTPLLPPNIAKMVRFTYLKNGVLFFALAHPAAKMEFDNIIKSIKTPLKKAISLCDATIEVSEFKAFVTYKSLRPHPKFEPKIVTFHERSTAQFINHFSSPRLFDLFEQIRKTIHANTTK